MCFSLAPASRRRVRIDLDFGAMRACSYARDRRFAFLRDPGDRLRWLVKAKAGQLLPRVRAGFGNDINVPLHQSGGDGAVSGGGVGEQRVAMVVDVAR